MFIRHPEGVAAAALSALFLAAGLEAQASYSVVDLVIPGGRPEGINELGEIVGRRTVGSQGRIFLHDPVTGTITDPGLPVGTNAAFARDLNDLGQIVGNAWDQPIDQPGRSFLFTPGVGMQDLGELQSGGRSAAFAVDNFGNVGGAADGTAFSMEAYFWPAGGPMASLQPGNEGSVRALSDTGWRGGSIGFSRLPFYIDPAGQLSLVPLPTGFDSGGVAAVSENGWLAGVMTDPSGTIREAFRFHPPSGQFDALGLVSRNGAVHGVDSQGTVVGFRQISTRVDPVAMVSFGGAPLVDLDTLLAPGSGYTILRAKGINEAGQICASARPASGPDTVVRLDLQRAPGTVGAAQVVGSGCSGIELRAGAPRIGRPWSLALRGASSARPLVLLLSPGQPAAVTLPGTTCMVYVASGNTVSAAGGITNTIGSFAEVFPLPDNTALIGSSFGAQALVLDGTAGVPVRLSSGLRLVIGG